MSLPSKPMRYYILIYLVFVIGLSVVMWNLGRSPSEFSICLDLYDDQTVDVEIRDHCSKIVEEWRKERDDKEAKEKRDYIESFRK